MPHSTNIVIIFPFMRRSHLVAVRPATARLVRGIGAEVADAQDALLGSDHMDVSFAHQCLRPFRVCVFENLAGVVVHGGTRR